MPTAIVGSAQHWTAPIHLSAHHIADFLVAKGWHVCFLSTPTSFLHRVRFSGDPVARERYDIWRRGGGSDHEGRLFYYTPLTLLPPSRLPVLNRPWFFRNWPRFTQPGLLRFLERKGFAQPDVMIMDSATMAPVWRMLKQPRLIYRVTDRNKDYPGLPSVIVGIEEQLAREADLVIYTGTSLEPYVEELQPRAKLCVPNGVDVKHFRTAQEPPEEYQDIPEPRALYVGTIAQWFDEDLVAQAAMACPEISFVIIGPDTDKLERLRDIGNVYLLGPKPYVRVPAYMQHAHVGLIPFGASGIKTFVDDINPLKLYEYMAAGLPVVCSPIHQVEMLDSPAIMAADADEFTEAVKMCCTTYTDGVSERKFSEQMDWSNQFSGLYDKMTTMTGSSDVNIGTRKNTPI